MKLVLGFLAVALLSGCASPPTVGEAVPAPSSRLLAYQAEEHGKGAAVTVVREGAIQAGHCYFGVYIDG